LAENDTETFAKMWGAFGAVIKEGIYEDSERRERLLALSRFTTSASEEPRSLTQYVENLRPNQTEIYYLIGESKQQLASNPVLEATRARGIEVLFLTDHVDAFWTTLPLDYEGKPLKSLSQGDVNFDLVPILDEGNDALKGDEDTKTVDEAVVLAAVNAALSEHVSDVRSSKRLTESPSCLIAEHAAPDRRLERILAQSNSAVASKPILELNMKHRLVRAIADAKATGNEETVTDVACLLFEQAQILDGQIPDDPAAFAQRLNRLVERGLDHISRSSNT
jgi:molecular chaperone HtpG